MQIWIIKFLIFLNWVFGFSTTVTGQNLYTIVPSEEPVGIYQFNPEYIKDARIRKILVEYSGKKSNDIIRKKPFKEKFDFGLEGTLEKRLNFYRTRNGADSALTLILKTNDSERCIIEQENPFYRLTQQHFSPNGTLLHEKKLLIKQLDFIPAQNCNQGVAYSEVAYTYDTLPNFIVKRELNELGLPFRTTHISTKNDTTTYEIVFLTNRHRKKIQTVTRDNNLVFYALNDQRNNINHSRTFAYEDNKLAVEHWSDFGLPTHRKEYLYDSETGHLKAALIKTLSTEEIEIIRYFILE
ncbi:MAG: hypothetical protein ACXITV_03480 [Luteibaculaceae bacterium]